MNPETGYCAAHGPDASEIMAKRGRKGAEALHQRYGTHGLDRDALPPLDSHQSAKVWLEAIGRAVSSGKLGHREAVAAIRAVEAWCKTEGERAKSEDLAELRDAVAELKRGKLRAS